MRYLAKGHYFSLSGRSPFGRLIYPIANSASLGTHVTLDLGGNARFGPDVQWVDQIDYSFDESRKGDFVRAIRRYYPDLDESRLQPSYTYPVSGRKSAVRARAPRISASTAPRTIPIVPMLPCTALSRPGLPPPWR